MASSYFLTPQALQDIEEIHDFIADDNPGAALRFINLLEKKCGSLVKTPAMGRRREELAPGLRSLPVRKYVIFYRQNKGRVEIIRILHGGRDFIALFESEETLPLNQQEGFLGSASTTDKEIKKLKRIWNAPHDKSHR